MICVLNHEHVYTNNICYVCHQVKDIRGDINCDGIVDARDIVALKTRLHDKVDLDDPRLDFNNDGLVDLDDVSELTNYVMSQ